MRVFFYSLFFAVIVALSIPVNIRAQEASLTSNLSLGSRGSQVFILQKMLNRDPDTRIALNGPGSPGNETDYFGNLTRTAVIRLQEKYANDILRPAGLARGNGYVGAYTRTKLHALFLARNSGTRPVSETSNAQNPNQKNLDMFLSAIETVGSAQGYSPDSLAKLKTQMERDIATTTDLRAAFIELVKNSSVPPNSPMSLRTLIKRTVTSLIFPHQVHAQAGSGSPFGGALVYSYYCSCSSTWLLTLNPLPPNYVTLLTYQPGSQAYLSYNIPQTEWLLGEYSGSGICKIYAGSGCISSPSQGMITPNVGSSL